MSEERCPECGSANLWGRVGPDVVQRGCNDCDWWHPFEWWESQKEVLRP